MHDKLAQVVEAGAAIARSLDLDETLQTVVEAAARVTNASYGALGVLGPDRRISRFITTGFTEAQREQLGALPTGRGILGVLIEEARPLRLHDLSQDPRSVGFPPSHPPMRSFLGAPVESRGEIYGNLYLTESHAGDFTDEDERVVLLLASLAGVAIENARLYRDATELAETARHAADARVGAHPGRGGRAARAGADGGDGAPRGGGRAACSRCGWSPSACPTSSPASSATTSSRGPAPTRSTPPRSPSATRSRDP